MKIMMMIKVIVSMLMTLKTVMKRIAKTLITLINNNIIHNKNAIRLYSIAV